MSSRSTKPSWQQKIARERIQILFKQAKRRAKTRPELSRRYVELARKIGMRYQVTLPKRLKRKFCKYCNTYFTPRNSTVRVVKGHKSIKCLKCGKIKRYPVK